MPPFNKHCSLVNALAGMNLILLNAALLIDAAALLRVRPILITHIVYRAFIANNIPNRSNIKNNFINLHED